MEITFLFDKLSFYFLICLTLYFSFSLFLFILWEFHTVHSYHPYFPPTPPRASLFLLTRLKVLALSSNKPNENRKPRSCSQIILAER